MALRPPHESRRAAVRLGCFGKLPFDREYLRVNLDSPIGRWIVNWVDAARESGALRGRDPEREIRAIVAPAGVGGEAAAILIRPSHDSYPRESVVAVSAVFPSAALADVWHLAPLCCAPLWSHMARGVIEAPTPAREAFDAVLEAAAHPLDDVAFAAERFAAMTTAPLRRPWLAMSGTDDEQAGAAARALIALCDPERREGPGFALRLPNAGSRVGRLRSDPAQVTAVWLRLVAAASARSIGTWPAVIEVWRRGALCWEGAYVFSRPVTADDLTALLADGAAQAESLDAAVSDAAELPPDAATRLANLTAADAASLADLWRASGEAPRP